MTKPLDSVHPTQGAATKPTTSAEDLAPDLVQPGMSVRAEGPGYEGYVVLDTLVRGRSAGGVRIAADLELTEVRELAREMSLKYALFHLPRGGAKAGVRMSADLRPDERMAALEDFGAKLAPIVANGIYCPGMDMNCGPDELRAIYRGAGLKLGRLADTARYTALSVFHSLEATVAALNISGRPATLAIEGFGSVARHLGMLLDEARFRVTAIATIEGAVRGREPFAPSSLAMAQDRDGDALVVTLPGARIDRNDVLTEQVDILIPSSRTSVITAEIARELRARAVVPVANAPYADGAADILAARGVLCLPGYLSNAGGAVAGPPSDAGLPFDETEELFAAHYRQIVDEVLRVARALQRPVHEIAEALAQMHVASRARPGRPPLARRLYNRFLKPLRPPRLRVATGRREFIDRVDRVLADIAQAERDATGECENAQR